MEFKPLPLLLVVGACGLSYWLGNQQAKTDRTQPVESVAEAGKRAMPEKTPALPKAAKRKQDATGNTAGRTYASLLGPPSAEEEAKGAVERVRDAFAEPNEFKRLQLFWRALTDLKPEDAQGIQDLFDEGDRLGRHYPQEYRYFAQRWGEVDGPAAVAHGVQAWQNRDGMDWMLSSMAEGWATQDAPAAVEWINSHDQEKPWMQNAVMEGLVRGLGHTNPALARRFVEQLGNDPKAANYFYQLADITIYSSGLKEAEQWYASLDTRQLSVPKAMLREHLADRYLRGGPEQAATFLSRHPDQLSGEYGSAVKVVTEWERTDPVKTRNWVATLPDAVRIPLEVRLGVR